MYSKIVRKRLVMLVHELDLRYIFNLSPFHWSFFHLALSYINFYFVAVAAAADFVVSFLFFRFCLFLFMFFSDFILFSLTEQTPTQTLQCVCYDKIVYARTRIYFALILYSRFSQFADGVFGACVCVCIYFVIISPHLHIPYHIQICICVVISIESKDVCKFVSLFLLPMLCVCFAFDLRGFKSSMNFIE